ncbi:MAG: DUF1559 domain-containing protein [Thermoguttaceae bacterium]|jgi:prepilin-type N-terminal cleavage/methylation domain-containing protein|nr:DUF1559 domain-containing protein [Thermoguttaceae bacterium]
MTLRTNHTEQSMDASSVVECACWTTVSLAPLLIWVNGPAVSAAQFAIRAMVLGVAVTGAIVLRVRKAARSKKWKERNDIQSAAWRHSAFTLVELLVVLAVIGVLMSLLLPAVMQARGSARRTLCQNNLHNLGLAMLAEAGVKRRFPASGNYSLDGARRYHSWVVDLLPGLERNDLASQWKFDRPYDDPANAALARITVPVLVCPDDETAIGPGGLSYAVNGGFGWTTGRPVYDCPSAFHVSANPPLAPIDLNGNGVACPSDPNQDGRPGDKNLFFWTGLFFLENWPKGLGTVRHHSLDSISDGSSNTLMLAESVRAGYDPLTGATWASPEPQRNSFFISAYVCEGLRCAPGNVDYRRANAGEPPYHLEAINAARSQAEGEAPWASSFHVGGVHVVFADGRIHFLSDGIEGAVYAGLMSPQGSRIRGPLAQPVTGIDSY